MVRRAHGISILTEGLTPQNGAFCIAAEVRERHTRRPARSQSTLRTQSVLRENYQIVPHAKPRYVARAPAAIDGLDANESITIAIDNHIPG